MVDINSESIADEYNTLLKELSNLLLIPVSRIGLKATTSEKIGIIGKNKAIAVQSLVNLREKSYGYLRWNQSTRFHP